MTTTNDNNVNNNDNNDNNNDENNDNNNNNNHNDNNNDENNDNSWKFGSVAKGTSLAAPSLCCYKDVAFQETDAHTKEETLVFTWLASSSPLIVTILEHFARWRFMITSSSYPPTVLL